MGDHLPDEAGRRLELALELFAAGEDMMRQTLSRKYPDADAEEIERRLTQWLRCRPEPDDAGSVQEHALSHRTNR